MMSLLGEQILLRVYLQSADRTPHEPTYQRLVKSARDAGLAGCTVLRGIAGFGSHDLHLASAWSLVKHVPIILEFVDEAEKIQIFIDGPMSQLMIGGMATLERAHVMMYRDRRHDQPSELQIASLKKPLSTISKIQARENMTINEDGILLRIFAGESDRIEDVPMHEAILKKARELGLAGATVLRGVEGFGANSIVHKASLLEMSSDLPIVIEIVDKQEKIQQLLPYLQREVKEGMITMEYIAIIFYRHNPADGRA